MRDQNHHFHPELIIPWLVLAILLTLTYALFFSAPYAGFEFTGGQVFDVLVDAPPGDDLQVGDQLLRVGELAWSQFQSDLRQTLFDDVQVGQVVPLRIERGGEVKTVNWRYPGPNRAQILQRLTSGWWLAYVFWLAGTVTLLFLRPKGALWQQLCAFYFLTAIWLAAGSGPSHWHVLESAIVLRAAVWLSVPVYLHLHWIFPKPLGHLPKGVLWGLYLAGLGLAVAQGFQYPPPSAYFLGFLLATGGSLALLVGHVVLKPAHREDIRLIGTATALALVPALGLGFIQVLTPTPPVTATGAILALPLLPGAYLYAAFRKRAAGLEVRANRFISLYLFLLLVGTASLISFALFNAWLEEANAAVLVGSTIAVLTAGTAALGFSRFERFVERRLLRMPLPPSHLLETYSSRITTSLDASSLISLLRDEVLPSLLVRQSALLRIDENGELHPLYTVGIDESQLPKTVESSDLLLSSKPYQVSQDGGNRRFPWVHLLFPLKVDGNAIGLWLLGSRDPDDFYTQAEISVLQTIANQTAIALANIAQAERLRALYQADIDRHETERTKLALRLHDRILNQMAVLFMSVDEQTASSNFEENYQTVVNQLRKTISGLRPATLNYGLNAALEELTDELSGRGNAGVDIQMEMEPGVYRYEPKIEAHLYRIVQQACENAMQHARAQTIRIHGSLGPNRAHLSVEDDGVGFATPEGSNFGVLLSNKQFGLVGMHERAALIGASLQIESNPGEGMKVSVRWEAEDAVSEQD